jgi:hypothetical protein
MLKCVPVADFQTCKYIVVFDGGVIGFIIILTQWVELPQSYFLFIGNKCWDTP